MKNDPEVHADILGQVVKHHLDMCRKGEDPDLADIRASGFYLWTVYQDAAIIAAAEDIRMDYQPETLERHAGWIFDIQSCYVRQYCWCTGSAEEASIWMAATRWTVDGHYPPEWTDKEIWAEIGRRRPVQMALAI